MLPYCPPPPFYSEGTKHFICEIPLLRKNYIITISNFLRTSVTCMNKKNVVHSSLSIVDLKIITFKLYIYLKITFCNYLILKDGNYQFIQLQ